MGGVRLCVGGGGHGAGCVECGVAAAAGLRARRCVCDYHMRIRLEGLCVRARACWVCVWVGGGGWDYVPSQRRTSLCMYSVDVCAVVHSAGCGVRVCLQICWWASCCASVHQPSSDSPSPPTLRLVQAATPATWRLRCTSAVLKPATVRKLCLLPYFLQITPPLLCRWPCAQRDVLTAQAQRRAGQCGQPHCHG